MTVDNVARGKKAEGMKAKLQDCLSTALKAKTGGMDTIGRKKKVTLKEDADNRHNSIRHRVSCHGRADGSKTSYNSTIRPALSLHVRCSSMHPE